MLEYQELIRELIKYEVLKRSVHNQKFKTDCQIRPA